MNAPFPWFGGKRRVAGRVWAAMGDVDNYVEPFAGSLAVLLERPASHLMRAETVNDADHYVANVWRAITYAPDEVARVSVDLNRLPFADDDPRSRAAEAAYTEGEL